MEFTQSILINPSRFKDKAINQIHTTEFWEELATVAHTRFTKYGDRLPKSNQLIGKQLFDGLITYMPAIACTRSSPRGMILIGNLEAQ